MIIHVIHSVLYKIKCLPIAFTRANIIVFD